MKKQAKRIIVAILGRQVRRLRKKHTFKIVAIAGSIGKTSTKFAVAAGLEARYKVRFQAGNYNDLVSVPLVFFGLPMPSLLNPLAWLATFVKIELALLRPYPYDVIVVELGTDGPGQLAQFKRYLEADIAVLTAIAPEHMQFFQSLEDVAKEELAVADFSNKLLVNQDLCPPELLALTSKAFLTYGLKQAANYEFQEPVYKDEKYDFAIRHDGTTLMQATGYEALAQTQLYSACAAVAVGMELGLQADEVMSGLRQLKPVSGRMQQLRGVQQSLIIDETYNASPEAVKAALDTLYGLNGYSQKIAILGNMNELGEFSQAAHADVGDYCDPKQLDLVATIGPDANEFLAPAARNKGCRVEQFDDPYAAGKFVKSHLKPRSVILVKGSQNKVYAEESIKLLLADEADTSKLVRQSNYWLGVKAKQFGQDAEGTRQ